MHHPPSADSAPPAWRHDGFKALGAEIVSDVPLPRLPSTRRGGRAALTIRDSGQAWEAESAAPDGPRFVRERRGDGVRYVAGGVGEFRISGDGSTITYSLAPGVAAGDVEHVLSGPALVMALQLQGGFFLHAAGVVSGGRMLALAAPHGFGKSTLAASFIDLGCTVYSDDVLPLREDGDGVLARQGQPWIKLWDSALEASGKDAGQYDAVLTGYDKRVVPAIEHTDEEVPLGAVYLLAPHRNPDAAATFSALGGSEAALRVLANTYSPEILTGDLAARSLDFATRVAEAVPVRVVSYFRSFEGLPALREAILRDFDEVRRG